VLENTGAELSSDPCVYCPNLLQQSKVPTVPLPEDATPETKIWTGSFCLHCDPLHSPDSDLPSTSALTAEVNTAAMSAYPRQRGRETAGLVACYGKLCQRLPIKMKPLSTCRAQHSLL